MVQETQLLYVGALLYFRFPNLLPLPHLLVVSVYLLVVSVYDIDVCAHNINV